MWIRIIILLLRMSSNSFALIYSFEVYESYKFTQKYKIYLFLPWSSLFFILINVLIWNSSNSPINWTHTTFVAKMLNYIFLVKGIYVLSENLFRMSIAFKSHSIKRSLLSSLCCLLHAWLYFSERRIRDLNTPDGFGQTITLLRCTK